VALLYGGRINKIKYKLLADKAIKYNDAKSILKIRIGNNIGLKNLVLSNFEMLFF
jgi:hypothetical protein